MRRTLLVTSLTALVLSAALAFAQVYRPAPTSPTDPSPARGNNGSRHNDFLQIARLGGPNIDILFVGDSITDNWSALGRPVWEKNFEPLKAANFGIGGDTTQGVLWRMQNGELVGFKAKVIILMLGTNNLGGYPNEQIAEGDALIVREFKKQQPQAKVLLLGIFPRGISPRDPARNDIREINALLAKLADNKQIFFLDIGEKFLAPDGSLPGANMPDYLHPSVKGYEIWTDAMMPKLQELLKS